MDFQKDDIVEWCGVKGIVKKVYPLQQKPVYVLFPDNIAHVFSIDGKYFNWHDSPSLILIDRPKKHFEFKDWEGGKKYENELRSIIYIKKNGSQILYLREQADSNIWYQKGINVSGIVDLAVGDAITVDVYISHSSGTTTVSTGGEGESIFTGYKIIT